MILCLFCKQDILQVPITFKKACNTSMKVNKLLLPVKFTYFFSYAALGSLYPYMMVFMRQLGLSPSESSTIFGITLFFAAVARPVTGLLADRWRKHKQILMLCAVVSCISFGCILAVPTLNRVHDGTMANKITFFCGMTDSYIVFCGGPNCGRTVGSDQPENRTSTMCQFACEAQSVSSICIYGTGSHEAQRCVNITNSAGLLNVNMEIDSFLQDTVDVKNNHCQYMTIVSMHDKGSTPLSGVHCSKNETISCHTMCPFFSKHNSCQSLNESGNFTIHFWLFAFIYFIGNMFFAPIPILIDALTYSHLGELRGKWGPQRVWGTIGYALFGVAAGFAMDAVKGKTGDINYSWCFGFFIIHNLLSTLAVYYYKKSNELKCSQPRQKLQQLMRNPEVLSLYIFVFTLGIFTGIIETFRFWHLQTLGATQLLLGLCLVMKCLPEIVIMFAMGYIIKRVGENVCLYIACAAYACRFIGYSFLDNPWYVLLIEPLHGFTFAVMYGAASAYGSRLTPEGMHGTMQAMLYTLHFGFGLGVGSLVGGPVFQYWGAVYTFQGFAVLSIVTLVIYVTAVLFIKNNRSPNRTGVEVGKPQAIDSLVSRRTVTDGDPADPLQNDIKDNTRA